MGNTRFLPIGYLENFIHSLENPDHKLKNMKRIVQKDSGFSCFEKADGEHWRPAGTDGYSTPVIGRFTSTGKYAPTYDDGGSPAAYPYLGADLPEIKDGTYIGFLILPIIPDEVNPTPSLEARIVRGTDYAVLATGERVGVIKTNSSQTLYVFKFDVFADATWVIDDKSPQLVITNDGNADTQPLFLVSNVPDYNWNSYTPTIDPDKNIHVALLDTYTDPPEQPPVDGSTGYGFFGSTALDGTREQIVDTDPLLLVFGFVDRLAGIQSYAEYSDALALHVKGIGRGLVVGVESGATGIRVEKRSLDQDTNFSGVEDASNLFEILDESTSHILFSISNDGWMVFNSFTVPDTSEIPQNGGILYTESGRLYYIGDGGWGIPTLGSDGKILSDQLPAISITEVYVVADIAERDALDVQSGDVSIVNDRGDGNSETYIWDGSAWITMQVPAVYVKMSPTSSQENTITPSAADVVPLTIKASGTQTANLLAISDSLDSLLFAIASGGALNTFTKTITADTILDDSYSVVLIDASSSAIDVTLPVANTCAGRIYHIKVIDRTNSVSVLPGDVGDTIDKASGLTLEDLDSVTLISDGNTGWWIV